MALNERAAVVPAGGYMFFADTDTTIPTDWKTMDLSAGPPTGGWESIGFSSLEDLPEFGSDGGDTSTLGAWERKVMRTQQTEASTDYLTINPYQFDRNVLEMYWGSQEGGTQGQFDVHEVGATPVEKAFLMVIVDGAVRVGFHASKANFRKDDSLELDVENFAQWPIRVTFLKSGSLPLFSWLGDEIAAPATQPVA